MRGKRLRGACSLFSAFWLAVFPACALAAPVPSPASPTGAQETLSAVALNGVGVSNGSVILREKDGTYAIRLDDALSWRLMMPVSAEQTYNGQTYVALGALKRIRVAYNDVLQRLELTVAPEYFKSTTVDSAQDVLAEAKISRGAFLNYDILGQAFSGQSGALTTTILNPGISLGNGALNAAFAAQTGSDGDVGPGVRRIATTWEQDMPAKHASLLIGDVTNIADTLVPEQQFVGVQIGSNFAAGPGMTINPRPSVAGAAASPSDADVYVDGRLVLQEPLPTGPFQIQNIPVMGDSGNVQLIVKNAGGVQQVVTTSYYGDPTLLKRGLSQYAIGAGFLETQASNGEPQYGVPLAQAYEQHGFTDRFTGEIDAQLAQGGESVSGGGIWAVPHVGLFDAAFAEGSGIGEGGSRFDYEYKGRGVSFGAGVSSLQQFSPFIIAPGLGQASESISRSSQLFASTPIGRGGSLSLTVLNENAGPENSTRTLSADYFTMFGKSQFNLDFFKTGGSIAADAVTMQLTFPIGDHRRYIASGSAGAGAGSADGTYQADPVLDGTHQQTGYALTLGTDFAAEADYLSNVAEINGGFSSIDGFANTQAEVAGSIASVDHHVLAARALAQAYGIVEVPGYKNVRVYVNGQFAGVTDARGDLLLHSLTPYQENVVTLESKDLPVTANIQSLRETVVPYYGDPAVARFLVRGAGGLIVHVKTADGAYLPAGAFLRANGSSWPVADRGEAYLEGLKAGPLVLSASAGGVHCSANLLVPADLLTIPDVGVITCR